MNATAEQIRELALVIAAQAEAIADGRVAVPAAAVARLADNVDTLRAFVAAPPAERPER